MSIRILGRMMRKLQDARSKVDELRVELTARRVEAECGAVKVVASCNKQLVSMEVDRESLSDPLDMVELKKSFLAASNEALEKAEKELKEEGKKALGEFETILPGLF
ncbi:MAG: hypothetical protein IEMM0002_0739 [bacterium]|nr:MAG: hypothetical protein IEMM0002_0739 [bacterium]